MNIINLLFSFKGRVTRTVYWTSEITAGAIIIIPQHTLFVKNSVPADNYETIAILLLLWPILAIQAKRWHDRNKSGLWILINFVPFIGFFWALIENGFLRGTSGNNEYGPEQLARISNET